jgi:NAD(P) transhydrogenase subunit alpha
MRLGIPKETFPGERRVAIVPGVIPALKKLGVDVIVERDAGDSAGFPDASYADVATIGSRSDVFQAEIIAQVRTPGSNPTGGAADIALPARAGSDYFAIHSRRNSHAKCR